MSLGLDDLKKRSKPKKAQSEKVNSEPQEDLRSNIAVKPWSNRGLAKAGVSRKQAVGVDFHVNEEWIEIQSQSFIWLNLNFEFEHLHEETDLKLQRRLLKIEKQILNSVDRVKNFIQFFGFSPRPIS